MRVLVVGSGGREHALAWKLAQSPRVSEVLTLPGNAGTAQVGRNLSGSVSDLDSIVRSAKAERVDLVVIGPDDALAGGLADQLAEAGIRAFGPTASAARLESSKSFAKNFMKRHGIPAAASMEFSRSGEAHEWCREARYPLVVKADGLALGKGVTIARNPLEAAIAIHRAMELGVFGEAGSKVLIEEFLEGQECSIHAIIDQSGYCLFPDARDHKAIYDGNLGPNTGGMGTLSPSGRLDEALWKQIEEEILQRFVDGLRKDGITFRGMLFPGLMLTAEGPKVLEFNCRFGDPETQVLLPRLKSDLLDLLEACTRDNIRKAEPEWDQRAACCVVLASGGYPLSYEKGKVIAGLEAAAAMPDTLVFHAGTRSEGDRTVTSGGRVLGLTALAGTPSAARERAYAAADAITFDNQYRREDIGA